MKALIVVVCALRVYYLLEICMYVTINVTVDVTVYVPVTYLLCNCLRT